MLGIFNVRTDVEAYDCTRGLCGHRKSLHWKLTGRKIPCRCWDSNPRQYCTWLFSRTLYQLSCPRPLDFEDCSWEDVAARFLRTKRSFLFQIPEKKKKGEKILGGNCTSNTELFLSGKGFVNLHDHSKDFPRRSLITHIATRVSKEPLWLGGCRQQRVPLQKGRSVALEERPPHSKQRLQAFLPSREAELRTGGRCLKCVISAWNRSRFNKTVFKPSTHSDGSPRP